MSRLYLEQAVRRRVADLPDVAVQDMTTVAGLTADGARSRVTGVRLQDDSTLAADLVVDATGPPLTAPRGSREFGFEPPCTSAVRVDTRYVSRTYRRTDSDGRDWKAAALIDDPATRRLAVAVPIKGDRRTTFVAGLQRQDLSSPAGPSPGTGASTGPASSTGPFARRYLAAAGGPSPSPGRSPSAAPSMTPTRKGQSRSAPTRSTATGPGPRLPHSTTTWSRCGSTRC